MDWISGVANSLLDGFEHVASGTVAYGLEHGNIYVLVFVLTIITLPAYYAANAMWKVTWTRAQQPAIEGKNILYVIAHPDDEAM